MAKRVKLGDIYAIPLPNGEFAFGRVFNDACIAIYKNTSTSIKDIPQTEDYQFIVGVYKDVLTSGKWEKVANRPFDNSDESWPSPMFVLDRISGEYSIYHKGEMKKSTKEECADLEEAAVWDAHHIVDRIMGDNKWN